MTPVEAAANDRAAREASLDSMQRIEHELLMLLRRVRRSAGAHARAIDPGLVSSGYAVLLVVAEQESVRSSEVARILDLDKAMISRQISRLESLGLISRESDPDDGRAQRLCLTEQGRGRIGALRDRERQEFVRRLAHWPAGDLERFADDLRRCKATFDGPGLPRVTIRAEALVPARRHGWGRRVMSHDDRRTRSTQRPGTCRPRS